MSQSNMLDCNVLGLNKLDCNEQMVPMCETVMSWRLSMLKCNELVHSTLVLNELECNRQMVLMHYTPTC